MLSSFYAEGKDMTFDINDRQFVSLLQKGDQLAWRRLLEEKGIKLLSIVSGILYDEQDALECYSDFVQELFADKIHKYKLNGKFWSWLIEVTKNYARNCRKVIFARKLRYRLLQEEEDFPEVTKVDDPLSILEKKDLTELLDEIFQEGMRDQCLLIVWLKERKGYEFATIAGLLHRPTSTIRVYYQRGKQKLRDIITEKHPYLLEDYNLNE
jgi:RNA polymerase sigma factor (sigma-70 family)